MRKLIAAPEQGNAFEEWLEDCKERITLWQVLQSRSACLSLLRIPQHWEIQEHGLFIEEEWLPGKDFRDFATTDRSFCKTLSLKLLALAAEKLGSLHAERFPFFKNSSGRIVHGDISPKNLIIAESGLVIWIDAENLRYARNPLICPVRKAFQAKPAYLAPEYARSGVLDQSAEIFALGAIAWEILRGAPIFSHEKRGQRQAVGYGWEEFLICLERVPREFQHLFRRSLHPESNCRFSTAFEFSLELQRALAQFR